MFQSEENCIAEATTTPENRLKLSSSFQPVGIHLRESLHYPVGSVSWSNACHASWKNL